MCEFCSKMNIEVSAPGKTILHGEHAAVYGKTAIALSLGLRTKVKLVSNDENKVSLDLKNLNLLKEWTLDKIKSYICPDEGCNFTSASHDTLKSIVDHFDLSSDEVPVVAFLYLYVYISNCHSSGSLVSCCLEVESELGISAGMGSSASFSVCFAAALLAAYGKVSVDLVSSDKDLINMWAFEAEKVFHGIPSGLDNSICTFGGGLLFENGTIIDTLANMPNINILLVNSKTPRNTKALVAFVKEKRQSHPDAIDSIMVGIDAISKETWKLLKKPQTSSTENSMLESMHDLVNMNQHLLNALGVGHVNLDVIHSIAKRFGCSAKLTGAGGGGCAFILLSEKIKKDEDSLNKMKDELKKCNFDIWDVFLGSSGVQLKIS